MPCSNPFSRPILLLLIPVFLFSCTTPDPISQWETYEITLQTQTAYPNPYTDVELWAVFTNESADTLLRPGFWDGGNTWKIRFASPDDHSLWQWQTYTSDPKDTSLGGKTGKIQAVKTAGNNRFIQHGLLKMSPGKRNVVHHDGTTFLLVGDTPWSIPFRATAEQVKIYAANRQEKGFNAALLMSVQPDMKAEGPDARNTPQGFTRGFADLHEGHINQLNPAYFQYLDSLTDILLDHEIAPVYQPIFHGFGWKGLDVLGNTINPEEYVRYCKYLLARYGSKPAFWLLAGDNGGKDPGVKESGEMMEKWDCYRQPTGLHYNPCDDYIAEWAINNPLKHCEHYNKSWQAENWLDFQWAQTGHSGEHLYHKVSRMYENQPVKASANGEPTYEGMNDGKNGLGWWQGEEAWMQLMSGGTMGVVYGAAGLWQWKVTADEEGWGVWASQNKSWQETLDMEGSRYVGYLAKALEGYDIADMEKRWDLAEDNRPLLAIEGKFYLSYLNEGGKISIPTVPAGLPWRWFDPQTGEWGDEGITEVNPVFITPGQSPKVLIIGEPNKPMH
ncbi:MAG: DUF4038 domain-containing protein [Bacteroidia bacterium]|nr:DUF4038 domain-containing protein [Bacteroidia bacterium]